ncbi:MAG: hypothetical protein AAGC79_05035 [Pseudomonadota bacterium]
MRNQLKVRRLLAAAALAFATLGTSAQAALLGETVGIDFIFGADENAIFPINGSGNFVVSAGPETLLASQFEIDISATSIVVTNVSTFNFSFRESFFGFRIRDVNGAFPDFTAAALSSASGLFIPQVTFDADNIYVNIVQVGLALAGGEAVINFSLASVTAVPLPAGLPLLLGGLAVLGLARAGRATPAQG